MSAFSTIASTDPRALVDVLCKLEEIITGIYDEKMPLTETLVETSTISSPIESVDQSVECLPSPLAESTEHSEPPITNEIYAQMLRVIGSSPIRPGDPLKSTIVVCGNTFGKTPDVPLGDIFIHTGNFCDERGGRGYEAINWLIDLPHRIKIVIPGTYDNHYTLCQLEHVVLGPGAGGIILLSGATTIVDGLRIFALYLDEFGLGESIGPDTTCDVIISHRPAAGILDKIHDGRSIGCTRTLEMLLAHPPRIYISGAHHAGYGYGWAYLDDTDEPTLCIAAAMSAPFSHGGAVNPPIVLSIDFL